jgi:hypothetical protein
LNSCVSNWKLLVVTFSFESLRSSPSHGCGIYCQYYIILQTVFGAPTGLLSCFIRNKMNLVHIQMTVTSVRHYLQSVSLREQAETDL